MWQFLKASVREILPFHCRMPNKQLIISSSQLQQSRIEKVIILFIQSLTQNTLLQAHDPKLCYTVDTLHSTMHSHLSGRDQKRRRCNPKDRCGWHVEWRPLNLPVAWPPRAVWDETFNTPAAFYSFQSWWRFSPCTLLAISRGDWD